MEVPTAGSRPTAAQAAGAVVPDEGVDEREQRFTASRGGRRERVVNRNAGS